MAGASLGLLLIIALAMLLPATHGTASASCATGEETEGCTTSRATTELALELKTAISVALENRVSLEIVPRSDGATGYGSAKLSVATNSNEGYGIFLSTDTANGDLLSTASSSEAAISNTSLNNVLLGNLEQNTYGYALETTEASDTTKYSHIPTDSTSIKTTSSTTPTGGDYAYGDTYYLSFGAKVGTDLPAGKYAGTIVVSAVANPRTVANLADLTYMQDMTSDICANTREHYTKQLIDTRDGKSYWVAKLKDGNCWMTQNLALDITEDRILTAADTDLPVGEEWGTTKANTTTTDGFSECQNTEIVMDGIESVSNTNFAKNCFVGDNKTHYVATVTEISTPASDSTGMGSFVQTQTRSWNLGKAVLATPLDKNGCVYSMNGIISNANGSYTYVTMPRGGKNWDDVSCAAVVKIDDSWMPNFVAQNRNITRNEFVRKTLEDGEVVWINVNDAEVNEADKDEAGNYIPFSYTGFVTVDLINKSYDPHYLLGNYYQWNTATAGTGGRSYSSNVNTVAGQVNATGSICPKGWRMLHASGAQATDEVARGDLYRLIKSYDLQTGSQWYDIPLTDDSRNLIQANPMYIFADGFMDMGTARLVAVNSTGSIWTGTADNSQALSPYSIIRMPAESFKVTEISWRRYEGRSVRCIAR